jgi:thioesterase domain-containing protein
MIATRQNACGTTEASSSSPALTKDKLKPSWLSLVEIQPNGSKPPLYCIHPLGGGVLCYRELALLLGTDQPVYGLQPQGLDGKQPPRTRVEDMASHYIQEIQSFQPHGPYFLAGYSFGGVVAFEMAQQLSKKGEKVGIVAMIDTCRPGYIKRMPLPIRVLLHLKNAIKIGPAYLGQKVKGWTEHSNYYLRQSYRRYVDVAQHAISITSHLNDENEHLEVIDANVQALGEYVFQAYPGDITLLRTEEKNRDEAVGVEYDRYFGWKDIILGELDMDYIPGSHLSVLQEPHVRTLAEKLGDRLNKAYAENLSTVGN